jgi:phage tail-like protein
MPIQRERLQGSNFSIVIDGMEPKEVLSIKSLETKCEAAGNNKPWGSREGVPQYQATPTPITHTEVEVKVVLSDDPDLYNWFEKSNDKNAGATDWKGGLRLVTLICYSQAGEETATWTLEDAYIVGYTGPEFDATSTDMANEGFKIAHKGFRRVS